MTQSLLDPVTHDLVREGGSFVRTTGAQEIAQGIKVRLLLFRGEAFLNTLLGVPYFSEILIKGIDEASLQGIFREAILGAKGVTELETLTLTYDPVDRSLAVDFVAFGTLDALAERLKIDETVVIPL